MRFVPGVLKIAVVASALAFAAPAAAQYTFLSPDKEPPPVRLHGWDHVVRVNLGASFFNAGRFIGGLQLLASPEFHF